MTLTTKQKNILAQLSTDRDFATPGEPTRTYVICCNHRTGSNLLSEALYRTGVAGDPIEYFNLGFIREFCRTRGHNQLPLFRYLEEMRQRRTSPNGVFGMNIKFDQVRLAFQNDPDVAERLLYRNDAHIFLYRRNKLKQAISAYKGQVRGVFNVVDGQSGEPSNQDAEVPFDPARIIRNLNSQSWIDEEWLAFFKKHGISYYSVAYEDLVDHYEFYIRDILRYIGVDARDVAIPTKPTVKIGNAEDDALARAFLGHLDPDGGYLASAADANRRASRQA